MFAQFLSSAVMFWLIGGVGGLLVEVYLLGL